MYVEKWNDIRAEAAQSATVLTLLRLADTMTPPIPISAGARLWVRCVLNLHVLTTR
jgi:hypothetical protein